MKHRFSCPALILVFCTFAVLVLAHEKTGWIAPESAKKMKNPIKPTKTSIQKGKEFHEKKCTLCNGTKGDGKGPASEGLNPKPTNFRESHGERVTDGDTFGRSRQEEEQCPHMKKFSQRRKDGM